MPVLSECKRYVLPLLLGELAAVSIQRALNLSALLIRINTNYINAVIDSQFTGNPRTMIVRISALEPSGRSTAGGRPEVTSMTCIRSKATTMLWRTLAVALLLLSACSPAGAQSTSAPLADPVTPADAMTPTEDSVPTAVPDAAPADTPAPTVEAVSALTVPTPAIVADAWVPLPRSKTSGCAIQAGLPDSACTPGALDARVNQSDLGTTVCSRGYTATVRPPVNVTEKIKRDQMAAYGLTGARLADYELDHLISLELGGAPADVANLWPEPWTGDGNAHQKDAVENEANRAVCSGRIALSDAQRQIAQDWLAFGRVLGALP